VVANTIRLNTNTSFKQSLPGQVFTDPSFYAAERQHLLGNSWQLIGHESQLHTDNDRAPATYIADYISGWPAIVVKSAKTGKLHAYHNVCRHKGGPLQWHDTSGVCDLNGLKCKYHGWAFSLEGKLLGVPHFSEPKDGKLDRSEFNLWPMRVATWRGLIFVQATPNSPDDPHSGVALTGQEADDAFIKANKAFCDRMNGSNGNRVPLEDFSLHSTTSHKLNCNWKLYIENYLEGYHIPCMHPSLNKQVDMKQYFVKVRDGYVEHVSPTAPGAAYEGTWLWHHPTLAINHYGEGLSLERVVPTGPKTCEIRYIYLFQGGKDADAAVKERTMNAIATSTEVTHEDIQIVEATQRGLDGGGYVSPGLLSPRHEEGVAYFQSLVRAAHTKAGMAY